MLSIVRQHAPMAALLLSLVLVGSGPGRAQPATPPPFEQEILGPGLYVFQTRIEHATCGDADRTGEVISYYAAVDGIPGSRTMRMSLLNSRFWPDWTLTVTPPTTVTAEARQAGVSGPAQGFSRFRGEFANGRFTGHGAREYSRTVEGRTTRCEVGYEMLLMRFDR